MAGDRGVFEEAMKRGHSYAWEGDWLKAIQEYRRAISEFPDDPVAQGSLGLAYLQVGQLSEALAAYRAVVRLRPEDIPTRRRVAEIYRELGHPSEAAKVWVELATYLEKEGSAEEAEAAWRQAALLDPEQLKVERTPESGLKILPAELDVEATPFEISEVRPEPTPIAAPPADLSADYSSEALSRRALVRLAETISPEGEPLRTPEPKDWWQQLKQRTGELAERLTRSSAAGEGSGLTALASAIRFHSAGRTSEAIRAYQKAVEEGLGGEEARFNLVVLEALAGRCAEGQVHLEGLSSLEYRVAARFGLGECFQKAGKEEEALAQFWQALRDADLASVPPESSQALQRAYDDVPAVSHPEERSRLVPLLAHFLGRADWWQRVVAVRQSLQALADGELNFALAEFIARSDGEELLSSLDLAWQASVGERTFTALEEIYRAIERAPDCLPLHLALAETLARQGRVEQAMEKLVVVANTFVTRGDGLRALGAYRRAAALAGWEASTARALLEFIVSREGEGVVLPVGLILTDAYRQRGWGEEALDLARWGVSRASSEPWSSRYLAKLGELYRELGQWEEAVRVYRDLKALDSSAEGPRQTLIDLYTRLEWAEEARREWEELLGVYRERGEAERALSWLEGAVAAQPQDIPLRAALAEAYLEANRKEEGSQTLDALGEMQLVAGRQQEAIATIRRIIGLRPHNVDQYRKLLKQLGG
ncbi:MAG: tetratricopeptide repeat protein [Chloroflexi bacterium]|nr:tetratricopeptide repeat protein [Chloroflexota bacterium]